MNQIETLKYIALNGNPVGTDAEADYNNYKSDPTFRKLAMQAASGGNLIGSPLESEYTQYRDTVNGSNQAQPSQQTTPQQPSTQSQQPVQDPLLANSDTNGQTTLEPNTDSMSISPNGQMPIPASTTQALYNGTKQLVLDKAQDIKEHPIRNGLELGSLAIPVAGDISIARSAISPIVKGLASAALNGGYEAARSKLSNGSVDPLSTGISTLLGGLGGLIGGGVAGKAVSNVDDLAARQAALQAQRDAQNLIVDNINNARPPEGFVLASQDSPNLWEAQGLKSPLNNGQTTPNQQLWSAKQYMAQGPYGNRIAPSSISDADAASWIKSQETIRDNLKDQRLVINPLTRNYYKELSPTDLKSITKKNIVNKLLNPAVDFINRNQQTVGNAGSLFSGLTPLAGSLSDYAIHKVAGN